MAATVKSALEAWLLDVVIRGDGPARLRLAWFGLVALHAARLRFGRARQVWCGYDRLMAFAEIPATIKVEACWSEYARDPVYWFYRAGGEQVGAVLYEPRRPPVWRAVRMVRGQQVGVRHFRRMVSAVRFVVEDAEVAGG